MKNSVSYLIFLFLSVSILSQNTKAISYQAVLRDNSNKLITNKEINLKISLLQNNNTIYAEKHNITTNSNGLITLKIGEGDNIFGDFSVIDWSLGNYLIVTEIDPDGAENYVLSTKTELLNVPYALYSEKAKNGISEEQSEAIMNNTRKYTRIEIDSLFYNNNLKLLDSIKKLQKAIRKNDSLLTDSSDSIHKMFSELNKRDFNSKETFSSDISMNIVYGQSLATGGETISPENFFSSLSFKTGVLFETNLIQSIEDANDKTKQKARFESLVEMTSEGKGLNGRMLTKKFNELIQDENGKDLSTFNFNLMGYVTGKGGQPLYMLTKRSNNTQFVEVKSGQMPIALKFGASHEGKSYLSLMQGIYFAKKFANQQGKTFEVSTLSYVQGEASNDKYDSIDKYYGKLENLFNDINNDVKIITGQKNDVQFITYQNASFAIYQVKNSPHYEENAYTEGVPLASLKLAIDKKNVHFGTPLYPFSKSPSSSDKLHLSNIGYALMSSMFGIKAKRTIIDNESEIVFYPIVDKVQIIKGDAKWFVRIPFSVPVQPLVIDTEGISGVNMRGHGNQPNYGFSILNNNNTEIITDVKLSTSNAITITTNEDPTNLELTYALSGVFGGGNLRDSQGNNIKTTFNGKSYRCDNWCPFFRIKL